MLDFINDAADSWGYLGVALLMLLENLFPPIPSEVVMPAAGAAAQAGDKSLIGVIIAGTVGSLLGAMPWYFIARWYGTERLKAWMDRYGHWLGTDGAEMERVDRWFDRRGYWAVLVGRLVPGVRTLISVPAGLSEMPLWPFLAATAVGTALWSALLASLGYWLEGQHEAIAQVLKFIGFGVIGLLLILYIVKIIYHTRGIRHKRDSGESPSSETTSYDSQQSTSA